MPWRTRQSAPCPSFACEREGKGKGGCWGPETCCASRAGRRRHGGDEHVLLRGPGPWHSTGGGGVWSMDARQLNQVATSARRSPAERKRVPTLPRPPPQTSSALSPPRYGLAVHALGQAGGTGFETVRMRDRILLGFAGGRWPPAARRRGGRRRIPFFARAPQASVLMLCASHRLIRRRASGACPTPGRWPRIRCAREAGEGTGSLAAGLPDADAPCEHGAGSAVIAPPCSGAAAPDGRLDQGNCARRVPEHVPWRFPCGEDPGRGPAGGSLS